MITSDRYINLYKIEPIYIKAKSIECKLIFFNYEKHHNSLVEGEVKNVLLWDDGAIMCFDDGSQISFLN